MKPGGSFNTRVYQNDLNQIQSGQYATSALIRLPLTSTFHAGGSPTPFGGRPDLNMDTIRNPIVGNVANGATVTPFRITLPEIANCIQLVWQALDNAGNYQCSYPLNTSGNALAPDGFNLLTHWAFGWMRVNGLGPWLPMSLMKSTDWAAGGTKLCAYPFGGFSGITAPMTFLDWIGYWDGQGDITDGPGSGNAFVLALTSVNTSLTSNGGSLGDVANYATPSGSGTEQVPPNTDTQRNQDVLVRQNGR